MTIRGTPVTAQNTADPSAPDTIVLIHGLWVTSRSWEKWAERYEARGYRVLTPAYPGFEVEVEALNEDPSPIEASTIPGVWRSFPTAACWSPNGPEPCASSRTASSSLNP